jgi:hypothetical protein
MRRFDESSLLFWWSKNEFSHSLALEPTPRARAVFGRFWVGLDFIFGPLVAQRVAELGRYAQRTAL